MANNACWSVSQGTKKKKGLPKTVHTKEKVSISQTKIPIILLIYFLYLNNKILS